MKLSARSIQALGQIVTGDKQISPYRSGPQLVNLFNDYGADDVYGDGFPSRWKYTEDRLRQLNNTPALSAIVREVLDPREFFDTDFDQNGACNYLNDMFKYDGYEVVLVEGIPKIRDRAGSDVEFIHPFKGSEEEGHIFIDEQTVKANEKILAGDYDGAITNARSLIEGFLIEIDTEITGDANPYDGDLPKLYKRVQKQLNLDPGSRPDLEGAIKQVLSGLTSIVHGIAGISNKMGDRHARKYKPDKRHAVLVVNAAKTMSNFLFETHRARRSKPS
jgi:hypothetical protein